MKLYFILIFLLAAACSQAQTTTGRVKWVSASNITYTYIGELLNGKPHGRGFAVSERGGIEVFGEFKNGMIDGSTVVRHINGRIVVAKWKQNKPEGTGVMITPDEDIDYGNFVNGIMEGKVISIHWNNKIVIGNNKNGKTNGRAILIDTDGNSISDRIYINDTANGPGYLYEVKNKRMFEGIWEKGERVRASTRNYPSFMRNPDFGAVVMADGIMVYSDLAEKEFHDTCFRYDIKNNKRWFGFYDQSKFRNGVILVGDSLRIIGQLVDGRKQGYCVEFKKDSYLAMGNFNNGVMDGPGISIDYDDSTIYDGILSENSFTGSASRLMKNKEIRIGNFNKGNLEGGKIIYPDGHTIVKGYDSEFQMEYTTGIILPNGQKIDPRPKEVCTAINFLLKEWENNFTNIKSGELSEYESDSYECLYRIEDGDSYINTNVEGKDGKLHNEFSGEISRLGSYIHTKTKYDELCKKLSSCAITSIAKAKSLKLIPKINKLTEEEKFEGIASFFTIPDYPGKKYNPQVRVMVKSTYNGYLLTVDIISKWK